MEQIEREAAIARCIHYTAEVRAAARRHAGTRVGGFYGRMADDLAEALGEMMRTSPADTRG